MNAVMESNSGKQQKDILFALAYQFQQAGDYHKAIGAYQESIRQSPASDSVYNNLGNCYRSVGRFDEALEQFEKALKIKPGKTSAELNKSLALLSLNRYEEAWPLYRNRLAVIDFRDEVLSCGKPEWNGQELDESETLFIYSNQGLGDELQALRYIPMVTRLAKNVIFEVHKSNYDLFKNVRGINELRKRQPSEDKSLPDFDYQCEIFSLPEIFNTTFDTVPPPRRPQFQADQNILDIIKGQRALYPDCKHIGLVWSGNPKNDLNPYRACGLVHQLPLLDLENCRFYSLQKGLPRKDIEKFADQTAGKLVDLADHLPNMVSTATAIDELDLLITTDTSVPHLAGTLGAESWVLLHDPADWRWTFDQEVTPWYPQMRLFRQKTPRVWPPVIEEVKQQLMSF